MRYDALTRVIVRTLKGYGFDVDVTENGRFIAAIGDRIFWYDVETERCYTLMSDLSRTWDMIVTPPKFLAYMKDMARLNNPSRPKN